MSTCKRVMMCLIYVPISAQADELATDTTSDEAGPSHEPRRVADEDDRPSGEAV